MKRPSGSNADEWHLFLCEHLDNRATSSGDGLAFIAVQIAEALDAAKDYSRGVIAMSDDAQDPFLHDPAAFERMVDETSEQQHTYPSKYPPGTHWAVDAAWAILDTVKPGIIPDDVRAFLAGQIAGRLMREGRPWQPIETALADRDVLLWVPPSAMLADLIGGHMEIGRGKADGRATEWMELPEPPKASEPRAIAE